jgi:hypothetical protein
MFQVYMPEAHYIDTTSLIMSVPVTTASICFAVPTSIKSVGRELTRIGRNIFRTTGHKHLSDRGGLIICRIMTEWHAGARRAGEARVAIIYVATENRTQLGFQWPTAAGAIHLVVVEVSHCAEGRNLL